MNILYIIHLVIDKFPILQFKSEEIEEIVISIGNNLIEQFTAGNDIEIMVKDKLYNG